MSKQPLISHSGSEHQPLLSTRASTSVSAVAVGVGAATFGYFLMFLSAICQSTRALLFHVAEKVYYYPPETALALSAVAFITFSVVYILVNDLQSKLRLPTDQYLRLAVRGSCAAVMLYLNNVALAHLPVGTSLTLFSTTPAITSVLAAIFLSDRLGLRDILILVVNLLGIVLVARPEMPEAHPDALLGVVCALCAAFSASVGLLLVKIMGTRVHFILNTLSIGISSAVLAIALCSAQSVGEIWQNGRGTLIAGLGAVVGFGTQACVNRGLQLTRPGPALVVRTFNVPLSFVLGLVFLGEGVSWVKLIGVIVVLSSVVVIGMLQFSKNKLTPEEEHRHSNSARNV